MLKRHTCQKREIISCILIHIIVSHEDHLHFLHVVLLVHLERASIDNILEARFVCPCVILPFCEFFHHIILKFMALFERLVISADKHHTQIDLFVANVYMQHVLFCAARNANWSPSFTCLHRWICHNEVENHLDIYKRPLCVRYSKIKIS